MATRAVCPACGDTREIRADGLSVGCPFHGDAELVHMDSAASERIRENILERARNTPPIDAGASPVDWQAIAADRGRSWHALGVVLGLCSAVVVVLIVITAVVLW